MQINLQNVEELFKDQNLRKLFPEFKPLFDSWLLAQRVPALRNLGKRSLLDFLNKLTEQHVEKLAEYFQTPVVINKLNYHIVENLETSLNDLPEVLEQYDGFLDLAMHRNGNKVYISLWR